ncbi:hypothetical protein J5X84_15680 [Streptosporangiaceae bacterium NEAU-GS5]|nr:hypothetical protein [Streptosporangiaceae bacterium NEAU-GS5]
MLHEQQHEASQGLIRGVPVEQVRRGGAQLIDAGELEAESAFWHQLLGRSIVKTCDTTSGTHSPHLPPARSG